MEKLSEKIPDPRELEKEIGEFLTKKFGDNVKIVSPMVMTQEAQQEKDGPSEKQKKKIVFDLKPQDLIDYLDQYIVKQDKAKAVLSTKICTHFNRIKRVEQDPETLGDMVGQIKNNVLMIGPTGVGKTYMIRLIAKKLGVPFVKGDATKFSETGYVGGDVEDLVRDLVREADNDIELAQYGIIYIDEIDKIASSRNLVGADVSRTGVQRALLKPMEETEVDLKVSHDPISMFQEIEHYRKTGSREKRTVNTKNILFIMSGAFSGLSEVVGKRVHKQNMGFGAEISSGRNRSDILNKMKSEDLIEFGFESEFVGRLPVKTVFEQLGTKDLHHILQNPNNPIILGKKLDFSAYGIDIKFADEALLLLAEKAAEENTGARGLVSAVEEALLPFEKQLPSTSVKKLAVTVETIKTPEKVLSLLAEGKDSAIEETYTRLADAEKIRVRQYFSENGERLAAKYKMAATPSRLDSATAYYCSSIADADHTMRKIKSCYDDIKKIEGYYYQSHGINLVLEEEAVDAIIEDVITKDMELKAVFRKLGDDFQHGLNLVREKTGRNRFFINRKALESPETYIAELLKLDESTKPKKTLLDGKST